MHSNPRLMALGIGLIAVLAACSNAGASSAPAASAAPTAAPSVAPSAAPSQAPSAEPSSPAPSAATGTTVALADSSLGKILVDGQGRTLYMFTKDADSTPSCYGDCATNWPALLATGPITVGAGLTASKFETVERTDGGTQVRVDEYPLYTFAHDAAPGDTNGQGLNGAWYVVGADGEPIK